MSRDKIEREILIDAPIERVWAAVTEAEHLGSWFADAGAKIDLRPGGALVLRWNDEGQYLGRVEQVEPPVLFSYRWASAVDVEPVDGASTLVEFRLIEVRGQTKLTVVEAGLAGLSASDVELAALYENHNEGWTAELAELMEYLGS
jgi:uncharacterized protein YndB with AHSA1/START domain